MEIEPSRLVLTAWRVTGTGGGVLKVKQVRGLHGEEEEKEE